jgi:hypothetical protein
MTADLVPGPALYGGQDLTHQAARHRGDRAAILAPDVLVMLAGRLVASLAVVELDPFDRALILEATERPKHGGEVRLQPSVPQPAPQLVDRPPVLRALR